MFCNLSWGFVKTLADPLVVGSSWFYITHIIRAHIVYIAYITQAHIWYIGLEKRFLGRKAAKRLVLVNSSGRKQQSAFGQFLLFPRSRVSCSSPGPGSDRSLPSLGRRLTRSEKVSGPRWGSIVDEGGVMELLSIPSRRSCRVPETPRRTCHRPMRGSCSLRFVYGSQSYFRSS